MNAIALVTLALCSAAFAANLPTPTPVGVVHQPPVNSSLPMPVPGNSSLPVNSSVPVNSSIPVPATGLPLPPHPQSEVPRSGRYLILSNGNVYDRVSDYIIPSSSYFGRQVYYTNQPIQYQTVQDIPVYQGRNYYRTVYY